MAFALVGMRLADVTLIKGGTAGRAGIARAVMARADLVDRNGALVARDLPVEDLYARPHALGTAKAPRAISHPRPARIRTASRRCSRAGIPTFSWRAS